MLTKLWDLISMLVSIGFIICLLFLAGLIIDPIQRRRQQERKRIAQVDYDQRVKDRRPVVKMSLGCYPFDQYDIERWLERWPPRMLSWIETVEFHWEPEGTPQFRGTGSNQKINIYIKGFYDRDPALSAVFAVMTHEIGHVAWFNCLDGDEQEKWKSFWADMQPVNITEYAATNELEDFADMFRIWHSGWNEQERLQQFDGRRHELLTIVEERIYSS